MDQVKLWVMGERANVGQSVAHVLAASLGTQQDNGKGNPTDGSKVEVLRELAPSL